MERDHLIWSTALEIVVNIPYVFLLSFSSKMPNFGVSYYHSCRSCKGLWPFWCHLCPVHSPSQEHLQQQNTCRNFISEWNPRIALNTAAHWPLKIRLTFEDNLQLVPQNVKDTVTGARLRDDMSLQPTPAGVLVEILTRLHRFIHVLQEPGGFKVSQRQEGKRDRGTGWWRFTCG